MNIESSHFCEAGLARKSNQDMILARSVEGAQLFLVADGMGGCANGGQASQAIADGFADWLPAQGISASLYAIRDRLRQINDRLLRDGGGSTCVFLLLLGGTYGILSSGDSRVYLRRGLTCTALTKDDVWENQESVRSRFSAAEMQRHPNYGRLVHAVGLQAALACSIQTGTLRKGDVFALCSDGVYKMCTDRFFRNALRCSGFFRLDVLRDRIRYEVYRNGAKDNLSLILVRYLGEG